MDNNKRLRAIDNCMMRWLSRLLLLPFFGASLLSTSVEVQFSAKLNCNTAPSHLCLRHAHDSVLATTSAKGISNKT